MADGCGSAICAGPADGRRLRHVLWLALVINAVMFAVEVTYGLVARSMSLQADALDFLGDAANYGISLAVLGSTLRRRAGASLLKGSAMTLFGAWVIAGSLYRVFVLGLPDALIMGVVGMLALVANLTCAALLFGFRKGDSNLRSVWLCSRNDALGNLAVLFAAAAVAATGTGWADLGVAAVMATLATTAGLSVIRQARAEMRTA
jgi:Co/Zn/Cd efflux system component